MTFYKNCTTLKNVIINLQKRVISVPYEREGDMADDKLREAALKPIATIKKPVIAAEKKTETKEAEVKEEAKKTEAKATKKAPAKKAPAKKAETKAAATKKVEAKKEEPKKEEAKAAETKTAAKKAPAKKAPAKKAAETKAPAAKKAPAKKAETKAAPAKKAPAKKAAAPKATKAAVKSSIVLQYADKEVTYSTLVDNAKAVFENNFGGKASDIKSLDLYVKPEEGKVYFVVNGDIQGDFAI